MARATYDLSDDRPEDGGHLLRHEHPAGEGPPDGGRRVDGIARLHLSLPARPDMTRIQDLLGSAEAAWLGERTQEAPDSTREYACDLDLPVGDMGPLLFRKSAIVGLGDPAHDGAAWHVPIEWHAATFKPLFPVFAGTLTVTEHQVVLDGHYAPPGGRLGAVLDVALLNVAARGTGRWFLRKVVAALVD
ncbi:MAG TPA: hypothetical protein VEI48_07130 [Candidatus Sulfotelmatobacter sp.]|nr:hypothetical protein [Candidatus Sulfotelmatobacter sp.]